MEHRDLLAGLFFKDVLESYGEEKTIRTKHESLTGLSVNPENLPGASFSM